MVKYRATCTFCWDFESDLPFDEALEAAQSQGEQLPLPDMANPRMAVRLDKLKEKVQKTRLGEFPVAEVMDAVTKSETKKEFECDGVRHSVKMNSQRYFVFRESMRCVACGLAGTRMFLEHHPAEKSPHFNLYGEEDGNLVLMTKDHIHAKFCGGVDRHSNYQTMCIICNNLKGHDNLTTDAIRELRLLYDDNKARNTKKKLHLLIEEAKARLTRPWDENLLKLSRNKQKSRASREAVVVESDLKIWDKGGEWVAGSIYDTAPDDARIVGCIRKGAYLEPLVAVSDNWMCKLGESQVIVVSQKYLAPKGKN